jgi:hypothetical protein
MSVFSFPKELEKLRWITAMCTCVHACRAENPECRWSMFGDKLTMEDEGCYRVRDAISKLSMYTRRPRKSNFRIFQHNLSIRRNTKERVTFATCASHDFISSDMTHWHLDIATVKNAAINAAINERGITTELSRLAREIQTRFVTRCVTRCATVERVIPSRTYTYMLLPVQSRFVTLHRVRERSHIAR